MTFSSWTEACQMFLLKPTVSPYIRFGFECSHDIVVLCIYQEPFEQRSHLCKETKTNCLDDSSWRQA